MSYSTITIGAALIASIYLLAQSPNKMFPTIASIASGVELLLTLGVMSLSVAKFRIDVILPALLVVAGIACWGKSSTKGAITAASTVGIIGAMQLLLALRLFS
ncbi:MAG TPA: hypothetical protein VLB44_22615 [Kofleriaceae bacterium]|nr:hypothetical protein [Kofleriaceae bacterium]